MYQLEELRCLELNILVPAAFDVALLFFLQNHIPSSWPHTIPQVLQFPDSNLFIAFKNPFLLPRSFGRSFLTCP